MKGFFSPTTVESEKTLLVPQCGACGLFRGCESPKMPVSGEGRLGVLVVGEAPGFVEDKRNKPFVGKSGRFLRGVLDEMGFNLDRDAWTTNSLICRPPDNATPTAKQIGYCRPNLTSLIRKLRPRVVLTLGRSALTSVLMGVWRKNMGELDRWTGWRMPLRDHWLCPTHHPAYLIREHDDMLDRQFKEHLCAAFSISKPPKTWDDLSGRVEVLYEVEKIREALAYMERCRWVAVDYETTCIKPEWPKARIVSCALSDSTRTVSYPWLPEAAEATRHLLMNPRVRKIASNIKMEERWTRKTFGRGARGWGWDTMLASHCLDSRPGICSLKFQALVRLGVPPWDDKVAPYLESRDGPYNRVREVPLEELLVYGGVDAFLEVVLAMRQRKDMGYDD